jgi:hypothetical protein
MRMKWVAAAFLMLAGLAPANAQMVRAQDPQSLVKALQEAGFQAKLDTDSRGDPRITSGLSGTRFYILFYNCTANRNCATVQFRTGYKLEKPIGLDRINEWNSRQRFAKAHLDTDNDPVIDMDVDLDDGGVSKALFIDNLEFWSSALPAFEKHIGYRD